MPRAPVPSAMGEHPCATDRPHEPLVPILCAHNETPSVTLEPFRRLLLTCFPLSPSLAARSTRATRCGSGMRTNSAGRQCPVHRYDWPPACASTSWTSPRRRASRPCDTWVRPLRWHCTGADRHRVRFRRLGGRIQRLGVRFRRLGGKSGRLGTGRGCGCWWPREARRNCRGCSTGWSGALSRSISRRSARAGASRLRCRRGCPRGHSPRTAPGPGRMGPAGPVHRGPPSGCGPRAGVRGGTLVADSVGRGGRWGRPRSRTPRGHGGDAVPPGPAATRVRPAAGLLVDLGWAMGLDSAVGLLVGLANGSRNAATVVDLVTVLLRPRADLCGVLAAAGSDTRLSTPPEARPPVRRPPFT